MTRPLGASFGDLLSQPHQYGGVGLGTIVTSLVFLLVITRRGVHDAAQPKRKAGGDFVTRLLNQEAPAR